MKRGASSCRGGRFQPQARPSRARTCEISSVSFPPLYEMRPIAGRGRKSTEMTDAAGRRGVHNFANGDKYEGDFSLDRKHGKGIMAWADGSVYEGDFRDDKAEGNGKKVR